MTEDVKKEIKKNFALRNFFNYIKKGIVKKDFFRTSMVIEKSMSLEKW